MNSKKIILTLIICLFTFHINAQDKSKSKSIIANSSSIRQYFEKEELEKMQKGELINHYIERVKLIIDTLPYIALATKPGITMADIGIPENTDNRKALDTQQEATKEFMESTVDFQSKILPYSDKVALITAIMYYQNIIKELHLINE